MAKKGKSGKAPPSLGHHVVVAGDVYRVLLDYLQENPGAVVTEQPPGQLENIGAPEPHPLDCSTRLLLFSIIDMVDDFVNEGICLEKISADNIVVFPNGRPKLARIDFLQRKNMSLEKFRANVEGNYGDLARIFMRYILEKVTVLPADVRHLIYLMGNHAWGMRLLINYHSATVPLANSTALHMRIHNYTWDILRVKDPDGFAYVMKNMEFVANWRQPLVNNEYILKYYRHKSSYGNNLAPGTDAFTWKERGLVSRFNRNGPSHPLDYALDPDPSSEDGLLYSQCLGLGHIYRSHFPRLTYSMQVGLQAIRKLRYIEMKSLFSNSLKEYKEIV